MSCSEGPAWPPAQLATCPAAGAPKCQRSRHEPSDSMYLYRILICMIVTCQKSDVVIIGKRKSRFSCGLAWREASARAAAGKSGKGALRMGAPCLTAALP